MCHIYVDEFADLKIAKDVCLNAKVQKPGVCNAMETMLVHQGIARDFLPDMADIFRNAGVEIRGCAKTMEMIPGIRAADETDWPS